MNTRKIASIFGVIMLMMTVAGVAYAHWEDWLYVDGYVNVGNLEVEESLHIYMYDINDKTDSLPYSQDVAYVDYIWEYYDGAYVKDIEFWIANAYPQLEFLIIVDYHNVGTIPAKIQELTMTAGPNLVLEGSGWDGMQDPLAKPYQLHGCHTGYLWYHFRVDNYVSEDDMLYFNLCTKFYNWNEPPYEALPPGVILDELPIPDWATDGVSGFYSRDGWNYPYGVPW